jgi:hypothetical protein
MGFRFFCIKNILARYIPHIFVNLIAERVAVSLKFLSAIREVLGSNLGRDTGYPD